MDTDPIPMTGVSADEVVEVKLALPTGVVAVNDTPIRVSIKIRPVTATRTFSAGLDLVGDSADLAYALSVDRVLLTIGGSTADLDRLSGATLVATLDVAGLKAGVHDVTVTANLPTGTTLVAADPATVKVTITEHRIAVPVGRRLTAMSRLFGTDGIRGVANVELKPTLAYALGRAVAHRLAGRGGSIVVGQDTRRSGDMFVAAIVAGTTSLGVDAHVVGVVPTPALAFITGAGPFAAGIMVSASHNPAIDNGLKVLDGDGLKLDDSIEDELEALIWRTEELPGVSNDDLGRMIDASARLDGYRAHRMGLAESIDARGLHLVLDAANGSGSVVGPEILASTGARVDVIHAAPDGSEHQRPVGRDGSGIARRGRRRGRRGCRLRARRRRGPADRGRCRAGGSSTATRSWASSPSSGWPAARCPAAASSSRSCRTAGSRRSSRRPVAMSCGPPSATSTSSRGCRSRGPSWAARRAATSSCSSTRRRATGSSPRSRSCGSWSASGRGLAELAAAIPMLPQQQRAVKARHKDQWEGDPVLQRAIADAARRLGDTGRVLVRPSGTEPALRVMVEGPDEALVTELADALATLVGERLD